MMDDLIWNSERSLWLYGADTWEKHLAQPCVMAFGPTGALHNEQIVESLRAAPRWSEVNMSKKVLNRPAANVAVLSYTAQAHREGGSPYQALCTSTYVKNGDAWMIAQHQQTPL